MPLIRKKTSNRASTNDRAKVRHKVKETKRKKARAAKKNPQWKSRKPKDPGIPNEFPYKDQLLAEIAEQRRMEVEEKERRKAEKKDALKNARAIVEEDTEEVGVASLGAKVVNNKVKPRPLSEQEKGSKEAEEDSEEEVPVLINRDLPTMNSVLEKADVVLEVVDARDPMVFRSEHVEQLSKDAGKKVLLVLNKIDTCPREALTAWAARLRTQCPALMFRSASAFLPEGPTMQDQLVKKVKGKGKAKIPINDALGAQPLLDCLSQWAKEKEGDEALTVAVVGVANVGKSSLINSLLKQATLPIYTLASSSRGPSTTEIPQEVTLEVDSQKIVLIDTPGFSFVSDEDTDQPTSAEDFRARDILLRSKGRIDRLKDPYPPVTHIVSRANTEDLMLLYSLPAFTKGDSSAFLSGVARSNQLVKKKGELDLAGAARIVLRDWSIGKFDRYTTPPAPVVDTATAQSESSITAKLDNVTQLYAYDEDILSSIRTRKERRKQGGLVKFACGSIDSRRVAVEEPWSGLEQNDDEESDGDGDGEVDDEGMDVDGEDKDEENEDEDDEEEDEKESDAETGDSQDGEEDEDADQDDEIELPRLSHKQKRKRGPESSIPLPPAKKVSFSTIPPANARGTKSDHRQKLGRPTAATTTKGRDKLKETRNKPAAKSASKPVEKKSKIANVVTAKIKAKGGVALAQQPKDNLDKGESEAYDFGKFF